MEEIIAYCGLNCSKCEAYMVTQKDDDEERKILAEKWSKQFNTDIKPEDINCDGCQTDTGRHISYCAMCEIRKCAKGRDVINCAYCEDYGCETLTKFLKKAPEAKKNLEKIRSSSQTE